MKELVKLFWSRVLMTEQEKQQARIRRSIKNMPSLSTTVGKVLEVCNKTDASPNELNKVISLDPVLTGQVLKLINSSYYSLVDKVTSLPRAITMLGMNTVKNMALSAAIIASVGPKGNTKGFSIHKFWAHSLSVGIAAKLFAGLRDYDVMQREELFFAGLLHDLGKVIIGPEYEHVFSIIEKEERCLIDVEKEVFGITHQDVGLQIAEKWKLNPFLNSCISRHHDFNIEVVEDERVAFVALADMYCNLHVSGLSGNTFPDVTRKDDLLKITGLEWDEILEKDEEIANEIEKAKVFLKV